MATTGTTSAAKEAAAEGWSYKRAGVDVDRGNALVERIKGLAASTRTPHVLGGIGGFAALCSIPPGLKEPTLVFSCDGVGTKLKVAISAKMHRSIGIDLVAMSINDLICSGAEPLSFLDYFATSRLDLEVAEDVVAGIAEGCRLSGCALVGGETAEMPDLYADKDYDLAGFATGVVERSRALSPEQVREGDAVIGLPSSGLHATGYSLARKLLIAEDTDLHAMDQRFGRSLAEELLEPTVIYVDAVRRLHEVTAVHALVHVTGGGLVENPPRVVPEALAWRLDPTTWHVPKVMQVIAELGRVPVEEMRRTFNMGLGMLAVVPADRAHEAVRTLNEADGETQGAGARLVGSIVARADLAVAFVDGSASPA